MTFGLTSAQLTRVLEAAGRAPSLHNSQPWSFWLTTDRIELHVDSDRLLSATDPDGRETRLACGAALFNLRLALDRAAQAKNGILHLITDPAQLTKLRAWAAEAQRCQTLESRLGRRMVHVDRTAEHDGRRSLDCRRTTTGPQDQWTLRDFGPPNRPERLPGKDFKDHPLIAVLATWTDRPRSQVHAGQALERVLLTATDLGLSISFLSQLIEVATVRERLRDLLGGRTYPQAVLRIGFGGPVPATPRRPVEDTVLVEAPVLSAPEPFPIP